MYETKAITENIQKMATLQSAGYNFINMFYNVFIQLNAF